MASEIRNRFTDTEMQIARETDLPELLSHLGYQVKRVGASILPRRWTACGSRIGVPGSGIPRIPEGMPSLFSSSFAENPFRKRWIPS